MSIIQNGQMSYEVRHTKWRPGRAVPVYYTWHPFTVDDEGKPIQLGD